MKRFILALSSIFMILSAAGCGNNTVSKAVEPTVSPVKEEFRVTEKNYETREWKKFLKEYDAWVNEYIKMLKKYADDPTNLTIISDYAKMMEELGEWEAKSEKIEKELNEASPTELAEYVSEILKIVARISEAAY